MAIVVASAMSGYTDTTSNASSSTTSGTLNVTADTLYFVQVSVTSTSDSWSASGDPTLTGGGASSWVLAAEVESFTTRHIYVFRTAESSPSGAAALTFTAPGSETYTGLCLKAWSVSGATATGTAGADGVVATNTATQGSGASSTTSVSASPAMTSGNGVFAAFGIWDTSQVPTSIRSGYTDLGDLYINGNVGQTAIYRADTDTAASVTYSVNTSVRAAIFIEVQTAGAAASAGQVVISASSDIQ